MEAHIIESIANAIEAYRKEHGLKKYEVAESLGITPNALRYKMRGEHDWKWSEILAISEMTGFSPDELTAFGS